MASIPPAVSARFRNLAFSYIVGAGNKHELQHHVVLSLMHKPFPRINGLCTITATHSASCLREGVWPPACELDPEMTQIEKALKLHVQYLTATSTPKHSHHTAILHMFLARFLHSPILKR